AAGYPDTPRRGDVITGAEGEGVFHAGTALDSQGNLVTAGGRVLAVVGTGDDLTAAREAAYAAVAEVSFDGAFHRTDIAQAAAAGERTKER
ncbi:MAG: phosphoribosylglycinamide synthetase C domain-containing protein, partial [Propionicimonas sp.]